MQRWARMKCLWLAENKIHGLVVELDEGEWRIRNQPKLGPTADRCRENSRPRIMRNQEWDTATAELDTLDLAELVLGLLSLDTVDSEAALGVVNQTEVLARLLDVDDIHEAGGEGHVGADLVVDLDQALHDNGLGLAVVESVLQAVADEDDQGETVASLVGTGRGLGSVATGQLVQQPVLGGAKALLVLLSCSLGMTVSIVIAFAFDLLWERARCPRIANLQMLCATHCHRTGTIDSRATDDL